MEQAQLIPLPDSAPPGAPSASRRRLRILEVASSGLAGCGARMGPVTQAVFELSHALAAQGHEVMLADAVARFPRSGLGGLAMVELPVAAAGAKLGRMARWLAAARLWRALRPYADPGHCDAIHVHGSWELAWLLARFGRTPVVYTAHTADWAVRAAASSSGRSRLARLKALGPTEAGTLRTVDAATAPGAFAARAAGAPGVHVIPMGTADRAADLPAREAARSALGLGPDDFAVLTVARLHPAKGIDVALGAMRMLRLEGLAWWFLGSPAGRFGHGPASAYAGRLQREAEGLPASFLGFVPRSDPQFLLRLAAADLFVLPSRVENQGIAALEAADAGLPIVASDIGGLGEMLRGAAVLVPPGDAAALAQAVEALRSSPERRRHLGALARRRAERHRWPEIAGRFAEIFASLRGGRADAAR